MHNPAILVIDDDELVCEILKTSLTDAGFSVDSALESESAIKRFNERQYDAVIVDLILPGKTGTELLETFKTINPDISVLLVTAHPAIETAQKAIQLNAFDYISKPFELRDLINKAKEAVEKTRRLREKKECERTLKTHLTENLKEIEFQNEALKVEQERFYGIFRSANFGLMVLNGLDEKIILINLHCKKLLGLSHLDDQQCFDQDYHHLVAPKISIEIDSIIRRLRDDSSYIGAEQVEIGSDKVLEFQGYPVISDGVMLAIAVMINDITERKSLEKQLLMASKLAGIGELAAGIAHEINNPIGFIKSNMGALNDYVEEINRLIGMYHNLLDSIENGKSVKEIARDIKSFEKEIDSNYVLDDIGKIVAENQDGLSRVTKIIRDLRTFTRFDNEQKSPLNINKIIEEALNLTRNECKYKAEIFTELSDVPEILGFSNQLAQVIVNLIINAVHAIETKGKITIRTYCEEKRITIEITDTGKGIKNDHLEHIFDPFFTTKASGEGTGLGLSIAQEIVRKHNGQINVHSVEGEGTTFSIELPVQTRLQETAKR